MDNRIIEQLEAAFAQEFEFNEKKTGVNVDEQG